MKIVIILGGTGFIGRAITEKFLYNGYKVVILSRQINELKCKKKLSSHSFYKKNLDNYINEKKIFFICNIDFSKESFENIKVKDFFKNNNLSVKNIFGIINLISETSGDKKDIYISTTCTIKNIISFISYMKNINENILFINMGSVAERNNGYFLAPYEKAKKLVKKKVLSSGLCDYHLVASYVRGKGEIKMKQVAKEVFNKIKISRKWMYSNYISIIDVDELAGSIFKIIFDFKILKGNKNIQINFTNGELSLGEIVKTLVGKYPNNFYLNGIFETLYLKFNYFIIKIFFRNNQFLMRLGKIGYLSTKSYEFQKKNSSLLSVGTKEYLIELEKNDSFEKKYNGGVKIFFSNNSKKIYYFNLKSKKDLKNIIKKSKH